MYFSVDPELGNALVLSEHQNPKDVLIFAGTPAEISTKLRELGAELGGVTGTALYLKGQQIMVRTGMGCLAGTGWPE